MCTKWEYFEKVTVGKQFVQAVDSICANIAEGHGRYSRKENIQFCYIARGSLDETRNWLIRSINRKLISIEQVQELESLINDIGKKLYAYINSLKNQLKESEESNNQEQWTKNKEL